MQWFKISQVILKCLADVLLFNILFSVQVSEFPRVSEFFLISILFSGIYIYIYDDDKYTVFFPGVPHCLSMSHFTPHLSLALVILWNTLMRILWRPAKMIQRASRSARMDFWRNWKTCSIHQVLNLIASDQVGSVFNIKTHFATRIRKPRYLFFGLTNQIYLIYPINCVLSQ